MTTWIWRKGWWDNSSIYDGDGQIIYTYFIAVNHMQRLEVLVGSQCQNGVQSF
jgi:hypothetical protein